MWKWNFPKVKNTHLPEITHLQNDEIEIGNQTVHTLHQGSKPFGKVTLISKKPLHFNYLLLTSTLHIPFNTRNFEPSLYHYV